MTWSLGLVNVAAIAAAGMWLRDFQLPEQIRGIAAVRTGIFALLYAPANLFLLLLFSRNTPLRLLRAVVPSVVAAASVLVAVLGFRSVLAYLVLPEPALLLAQVAVGAVAGLGTLHAIDAEFRSQVLALLARARGRATPEPTREAPP